MCGVHHLDALFGGGCRSSALRIGSSWSIPPLRRSPTPRRRERRSWGGDFPDANLCDGSSGAAGGRAIDHPGSHTVESRELRARARSAHGSRGRPMHVALLAVASSAMRVQLPQRRASGEVRDGRIGVGIGHQLGREWPPAAA